MNTKQVLNDEEIKRGIEKIIDDILKENPDPKNLALIGIITRGTPLAKRMQNIISKKTAVVVKTGSLDTRPYRDDLKTNVNEDRSEIPFDITGKDIILVDDVMSTGRTIRAAMDALMEYGRPKSVKTAVLIDRGHRELPISSDYTGTRVPTSVKEKIKVKLAEVDGGKDMAYIVTQ